MGGVWHRWIDVSVAPMVRGNGGVWHNQTSRRHNERIMVCGLAETNCRFVDVVVLRVTGQFRILVDHSGPKVILTAAIIAPRISF